MLVYIKKLLAPALMVMITFLSSGCKKFLDAKSDGQLQLLETVQDCQALLDDTYQVNELNPVAGEVSADDYFLTDDVFSQLLAFDQRKYTWVNAQQFPPGAGNDWSFAYQNVYKGSLVLDNIDKVKRTAGDETAWKNAKGHALFIRGQAFLHIAGIWAQAYNEATAAEEIGIPLRVDPDFNITSVRSSLKQTYEQIIRDLTEAADHLPETPLHLLRPSKAGAYGLLARAYLFMRQYELSGQYADKALQIKHTLKDFNTLNGDQVPLFPFAPRFSNEEIITESNMVVSPALVFVRARIVPELYNLYSENDLRKKLFFIDNGDGTVSFRGSYSGGISLFDGIATDELYLIRAESYARQNKVAEAMADLNALLVTRWEKDPVTNTTTYIQQTATDAADALNKILVERRKELVMRGLRWMDIKRLNREGANIKLTRTVNGQTYELLPNSNPYALAIPEDVIKLSGMMQNPR